MTLTTGTDLGRAWHLLHEARESIDPELRKAVDRLAEPIRTVVGYHFGWWDEQGRPARADWGKGVRGALVLGAARAVGADAGAAVATASAVELVHNFTVVHDDVMDGDVLRRGRATVWSAFGTSQAILAGDAMLVLALGTLSAQYRPQAVREVSRTLVDLVAGQGCDLAFEARSDVELEECLQMAAGKTASLLACACAVGALAAGAAPEQVDALRAFGHHLGLAFQLVDDLLGIWGDSRTTGKAVGADLRLRKKSLPVVAALAAEGPAADRLAELYHRAGALPDAEVVEAASLIERAGGRAWARAEVVRQRRRALDCLAAATTGAAADPDLLAIADLIAGREL
ncbi:polyprenyl synthetase family protein [Kitasatospora sp. NPDC058965]|uniref:polyprenyl synthetase family protein n=1 Tax=Kitasatospora sp. NPDC058965 TaxID=3346682 RepID=UPI0036B5C8BE